VDETGEASEIVRVRLRQDAMAEVEDVAVASAGLGEDPGSLTGRCVPSAKERGRVEVALHRPARHPSPAVGERDPPVETDDVAARGR
jgi:hypothetical protein